MSQVLNSLIEQQIKRLCGNDFQSFIEDLYIIRYGSDFTPVKSKRDKGSDGFLNSSQTTLAVYGPERRDLRRFKSKVRDDYNSYQKYWASRYPNWQLVYNLSFTAEELRFLDSLKPDTQRVSPRHLLDMIEGLTWSNKRRVAEKLGIDEQFLQNDILAAILDDLLKDDQRPHALPPYRKPIYIEEKIEINFTQSDVERAKDQYRDCVLHFGVLQGLLKGYSDQQRQALRYKIREHYSQYSGSLKERLEHLTERYTDKCPHDDEYRYFVHVVLLYFFEQCLIGKKTVDETL